MYTENRLEANSKSFVYLLVLAWIVCIWIEYPLCLSNIVIIVVTDKYKRIDIMLEKHEYPVGMRHPEINLKLNIGKVTRMNGGKLCMCVYKAYKWITSFIRMVGFHWRIIKKRLDILKPINFYTLVWLLSCVETIHTFFSQKNLVLSMWWILMRQIQSNCCVLQKSLLKMDEYSHFIWKFGNFLERVNSVYFAPLLKIMALSWVWSNTVSGTLSLRWARNIFKTNI